MALYRLSTETMIDLSKAWTITRRRELEVIPQVATILPIMDSAHKGLFVFTGKESNEVSAVKTLSKKQSNADQQHDDYYRGGFYFLTSQVSLCAALDREEEVQVLQDLREHLYPDGLFGVTRSYSEETGAADLLERRLTDDIKDKLKTFLVRPGLTMLDVIELQIKKARELGELEEEKRRLVAFEAQNPTPSLGDERRARFDWIEAVRMLERTLRLAVRQKTTTEQAANSLLETLRREEAEADKKYLEEKREKSEGK